MKLHTIILVLVFGGFLRAEDLSPPQFAKEILDRAQTQKFVLPHEIECSENKSVFRYLYEGIPFTATLERESQLIGSDLTIIQIVGDDNNLRYQIYEKKMEANGGKSPSKLYHAATSQIIGSLLTRKDGPGFIVKLSKEQITQYCRAYKSELEKRKSPEGQNPSVEKQDEEAVGDPD